MYRMFDAHCHIYPDQIAQKAVEGIDRFYGHLPFQPYDGTTGTLYRIGREAGISHFLVHSVATSPRQVSGVNRYIASEVAASDGAFTGLGTLHPDSEHPEQDFGELVSLGLKGVKLHPDFQRFEADSPSAMRIYGLCAEAGLPVLVHTGDHRFDYSNPNRVANVLRAFPKLRFVGAHFGGWSVWDDAVKTLSGFDNIIVDTSSTFYALDRNIGKALIRQWGADRVMFGTDYPMWNPRPEISCLLEMGLAEDEYRRIFWDNAAEVFGLGGGKEPSPAITFVPSAEMKVSLAPGQEEMLSTKEDIKTIIRDNPDTVMAFDILEGGDLIGFVLVHRFEPGKYFLWEYAIDLKHQNRHKGTKALAAFIDYLKTSHGAKEITTTYIFGNDHAKHVYEKVGFVETDVVDEPDCHEVNMAYYL